MDIGEQVRIFIRRAVFPNGSQKNQPFYLEGEIKELSPIHVVLRGRFQVKKNRRPQNCCRKILRANIERMERI